MSEAKRRTSLVVFEGVGTALPSALKFENISNAKLILPHEFSHLISLLETIEENDKILYQLECEKVPFLFSSAMLIKLLGITPSVKTRIGIVDHIGPRLIDPASQFSEILGMFRFADEKEKVGEILRIRMNALNSTIFKRSSGNTLIGSGKGRGGGGGGIVGGRGDGRAAARGRSQTEHVAASGGDRDRCSAPEIILEKTLSSDKDGGSKLESTTDIVGTEMIVNQIEPDSVSNKISSCNVEESVGTSDVTAEKTPSKTESTAAKKDMDTISNDRGASGGSIPPSSLALAPEEVAATLDSSADESTQNLATAGETDTAYRPDASNDSNDTGNDDNSKLPSGDFGVSPNPNADETGAVIWLQKAVSSADSTLPNAMSGIMEKQALGAAFYKPWATRMFTFTPATRVLSYSAVTETGRDKRGSVRVDADRARTVAKDEAGGRAYAFELYVFKLSASGEAAEKNRRRCCER